MSFLQIGSWNIEHLSNRRENPQSAYALADHIEMAGIEILALQEVYVTHNEGSERRNAELDLVCELLHEHLGREWKYEVFRNRQQGDRSQLCALMWDKTRVSKSGVIEIPVPERAGGYPVWDRIPHAVKFTIDVPRWRKTDAGEWERRDETSSVIVINVHMKSNYDDEAEGRERRAIEAVELAARLDDVKSQLGDESLIILGDTNILDHHSLVALSVTSG
jgi:endonuclease/exonuclease/phosphatase family metal-dependent hydrolase